MPILRLQKGAIRWYFGSINKNECDFILGIRGAPEAFKLYIYDRPRIALYRKFETNISRNESARPHVSMSDLYITKIGPPISITNYRSFAITSYTYNLIHTECCLYIYTTNNGATGKQFLLPKYKLCREGFLFLPCNNQPSPRVAKYTKRTTIKS